MVFLSWSQLETSFFIVTITGATFSGYYYSYYTTGLNPVGRTYYLYRNTGTWTEAGANWSNKPAYTTSQGVSTAMPASFGWVSWNVKDIVQRTHA
jgi:hypothetical protein